MPLVIYPSLDARTMDIELNDDVIASNLSGGTDVYYSPDLDLSDKSIVFASYPVVH